MRISAYLHTIRGYSIIERACLLADMRFYGMRENYSENEAKENEHESL